MTQLERNVVSNAQYHCRKCLEVSSMPRDSENNVLEEPAHRALSITGYEVTPNDLRTCSGLRKRNTVILKFKY